MAVAVISLVNIAGCEIPALISDFFYRINRPATREGEALQRVKKPHRQRFVLAKETGQTGPFSSRSLVWGDSESEES